MATIRTALPMAGGRNRVPDPRLESVTMTEVGATVNDTRPSSGGPDGGSFFRRNIVVPNTASPMQMNLSGTGLAAIPLNVPGDWSFSWYARKAPAGGPGTRVDWAWYDAAGGLLGPSTNSGAGFTATASWNRFAQVMTPLDGAAYVQLRMIWTGIALAGQNLDFAMAQFEPGNTASEFTDNRTISPLLVLNYAVRRGSRNVSLELLGSKYPTVFLREAQSKSGTLSLLFRGDAISREAEDFLASAGRFTFSEPSVGEEWDFVVLGDITRTRQAGTDYWIVDAVVREVEP